MKLPAPALDKGITVLQLLADDSELSLETICNLTQVPKASLLRFLETLIAKGCVSKDPKTKKYRALMQLVPMNSSNSDFLRLVEESLDELSHEQGATAEWFEVSDEAARVVRRHEPENTYVRVAARVGFRMDIHTYFEAIAQVALATGRIVKSEGSEYHKPEWRQKHILTEEEIQADVKKVQENDFLAVDDYYNSSGVRRVAIAVMNEDDSLQGILSLAYSYEPDQEALIASAAVALKRSARLLQQHLRTQKFKK